MKSYKTNIPTNSLTLQYLPVDYTDVFACNVKEAKKLSIEAIMIDFWTVMPQWVNVLFKLRNILVRPFGLETGGFDDRSEKLKAMIYAGSGSNGLMSVASKSDNEIVVLLSDTHLDAYMSVFIEERDKLQIVSVITLVRYHNKLGRFYFFFIRPFHGVIVKSLLKSTLKRMIK